MQMTLWYTLRYRSYFSSTIRETLKIKRLKIASNCYFQDVEYSSTYIWSISWKKIVACDMSQLCNMSHFEKTENFGETCGVKNSNFGFIFEARTKSSHDVRKNTFFSDVMRGFCPGFKNEAKIWLFDTTIYARIFYFLKMWHVTGL